MSFRSGSLSATRFVVGQPYATIQAAIAAADAAGGGVVLVPEGSYTENLTVPSKVVVEGQGDLYIGALTGKGGVKLTGHHVVSAASAFCGFVGINFVNDATAATLTISGTPSIVTIAKCKFFLSGTSTVSNYSLSMTSTTAQALVTNSEFYDLDPTTFVSNTSVAALVSVTGAGSQISFQNCILSRGKNVTPLKTMNVTDKGTVSFQDCNVEGWVSISATSNTTAVRAEDTTFSVPYSGTPTGQYPVFLTDHYLCKVELQNCKVGSYGATWFAGPGDVNVYSPLGTTNQDTSSFTPPFTQIIPKGFDIDNISAGNPPTLTTKQNHGMTYGVGYDRVLIWGHPNPNLNRVVKISATPTPTTMTLDANTLTTDTVAPRAITGTAGASTLAQISMASTTGFTVGETVLISGHTEKIFNGLRRITNINPGVYIEITLPASGAFSGGATGYVSRLAPGTSAFGGGTALTQGGTVIVPAPGVMQPIRLSTSGANPLFQTANNHGFSVGDMVLVVGHDDGVTSGASGRLDTVFALDAVSPLTKFQLTTTTTQSGTNQGVVVRVPKGNPFGATKPLHGPLVLTPVDDNNAYTGYQYPAGTVYLDDPLPGKVPDIRGMIMPGVSRSLLNREGIRNVTGAGASTPLPVFWSDEVIVVDNLAFSAVFMLPGFVEEGAYVGRKIRFVANGNPTSFNISVTTPNGFLYKRGSTSISTATPIMSDASTYSVTLVCVSAPSLTELSETGFVTGSIWDVVATNNQFSDLNIAYGTITLFNGTSSTTASLGTNRYDSGVVVLTLKSTVGGISASVATIKGEVSGGNLTVTLVHASTGVSVTASSNLVYQFVIYGVTSTSTYNL